METKAALMQKKKKKEKTKAALCAAVLEVLDKDNYVDWSVRVKTYLMAQELWNIVKATTETPQQEANEKAWSKKNSMALHVIQISCGSDAFSKIREINSAKQAWDTLAGKYNVSKITVSGISLPLLSLECTCLYIINVK
jgi:hypothetical protein